MSRFCKAFSNAPIPLNNDSNFTMLSPPFFATTRAFFRLFVQVDCLSAYRTSTFFVLCIFVQSQSFVDFVFIKISVRCFLIIIETTTPYFFGKMMFTQIFPCFVKRWLSLRTCQLDDAVIATDLFPFYCVGQFLVCHVRTAYFVRTISA